MNLKNLITSGYNFKDEEYELKLKFMLFNSMLLFNVAIVLVATIARLINAQYIQAIVDITYVIFASTIIYSARQSIHNFDKLVYYLMFLSYLIVSFSFYIGVIVIAGLSWYIVLLLIIFFFKGGKDGIIVFIISLITIVLISFTKHNYPFTEILFGLIPFFVSLFFMYYYERRNNNVKHRLIENNKILNEKNEELLVLNKKLELLSIIDPLTKIYNRLKLDTVMEIHFETYKRYKNIFSIIIIDIDNFKEVNDIHGHLVGDDILKSMVEIIKSNIRKTDTFGRWGGEEFMIICEEINCDDTYLLGEKIRKSIEDYEFDVIGKKTISLGISEINCEISINELIRRADEALYNAKNTGRNKTIKFKNIKL